ncbi:MAG: helix-turn-helix transcriptional regulator [Actinobacteria bacterium]|nr:helix-turn-helix transcriptional regulator [Actinomycetota bacterium]
MKRTSVAHLNCAVAQTLDVVGEWWTLLVVRNLMWGQRRFEAIQADLGIARNILSDRLGTLVHHEIVERVKYQDHPERFEYHLTQKGRELFPVIAALMACGDKWAAPMGAPVHLVHSCGHAVTPTVVCDHCGTPLQLGDVTACSGPGRARPSAPAT